MNTTDTPYPPHTPPAAPEGMRWEYRGMGWMDRCETIYYAVHDYTGSVLVSAQGYQPGGFETQHYFEAVPILKDSGFIETRDKSGLDVEALKQRLSAENPKEAQGRKKCPMHLLSPSAMRETANALGSGAAKYGARNYRTAGVNATTYVAAILRHVTAWNDGEDLDPESGLSHIAHAAACCDILLDCAATGMLRDDRSKKPA